MARKKGIAKPNDDNSRLLREGMRKTWDKSPCFRCNNASHPSNQCSANADATTFFAEKDGAVDTVHKKEADEWFKTYVLKNKDGKFPPEVAPSINTPAAAGLSSTLPIRGSGNVSQQTFGGASANVSSQSQTRVQQPDEPLLYEEFTKGRWEREDPITRGEGPKGNEPYAGGTHIIEQPKNPNRIGEIVRVIANHLLIEKVPELLNEYSIDYNPTKGRVEKRRIFNALLDSKLLDLDGLAWATDHERLWIKDKTLPKELKEFLDFPYTKPSGKEGTMISVNFNFDREIKPRDLQDSAKNAEFQTQTTTIRALNAIVSRKLVEEMFTNKDQPTLKGITMTKANKCFINNGISPLKGRGLVAVRGYFFSVRPGEKNTLLNINTATSAFLSPILVSHFLQLTGNNKAAAEKLLKGAKLRVTYNRMDKADDSIKGSRNDEVNRGKIFRQFGKAAQDQDYYIGEKGSKTLGGKVLDYFKDLGVSVTSGCACVNVGPFFDPDDNDAAKNAVWVPAECLEILPMNPVKTTLDTDHTSAMMNVANREPAKNARLIVKEGIRRLGIDQKDELEDIGFSIRPEPIEFDARILPPPQLYYNVNGRIRSVDPKFAAWNLKGVRFQGAGVATALHVVHVNGGQENLKPCEPESLGHWLQESMKGHGMKIPGTFDKKKVHHLYAEGSTKFANSFQDLLRSFDEKAVTLVILPSPDQQLYSTIKRIGDTSGVITVCCQNDKYDTQTLRDRKPLGRPPQDPKDALEQQLSNLSLKFNLKLGKDTHHFDSHFIRDMDGTIIMGADVGHPPVGGPAASPSIAALVASIDGNMMNYPASIRLQAGRQETIEDLRGMVSERLRAWRENNNNSLPDQIVFFRDGVAENQFADIKEREVKAIKMAYDDLNVSNQAYAVTFIVVGKRHHTRFYPKHSTDATKNGNLRPGLVVDSVVTTPGQQDFFCQAHAAIKGTARSAHYHILVDEINWTFDVHQEVVRYRDFLFNLHESNTVRPTNSPMPFPAQLKVSRIALLRTLRIVSASAAVVI
ncbi:Piwi-domain-containing protein [Lophium mytilinum]|uniref:Piwi-domain-containing protein n=1 Tax=Lophium mytilinum TaxID=390894 RepID=A0A6A6RFK7_9PEZI|nr:Piwi-domain-containing protein [Lophium mytilinum]